MSIAPLIGIKRHCVNSDGQGITTLVAFHGCSLECKYCLNPQSITPNANVMKRTPEEVINILRKDELYFVTTGGGVTFGGGEPLLWSNFIKEVLDLGAKEWHTTIETSLNVPLVNLKMLHPYIEEYIVDIKDMNSSIYQRYTSKDNEQVLNNMEWLITNGMADKIICRIPFIPNFNDASSQEKSINALKKMGVKRFDKFTYIT